MNNITKMIDSCEEVVIAVTDEEGVLVLVDYLLKQATKGNVPAIVLLHTYVAKSGVSLNYLVNDLLPGLLHFYMSTNAEIIDHAIEAAIGVAQTLDQKEMQMWLPELSLDFEKVYDCVYTILSMYKTWKTFDEKKHVKACSLSCPRSILDQVLHNSA